jgi:hypothetical protein
MMKKLGDNFLPIFCLSLGISAIILAFRNSSAAKLKTVDKADSIQYGNRLIEFFEKESIESIYDKYDKYINMGISPRNAFGMLTEENK